MSDAYDSPWKGALSAYFPDFLALLFPSVHQGIDWGLRHTFLDKELQRLAWDNKLGSRTVDKLVEVHGRGGEKSLILVHVEVQAQVDTGFEQRMFVYHYRIYDRYQQPIVSLGVLADANPAWHPNGFGYARWGCRIQLDFPVVKLLDLEWGQLRASRNPFAVLVQAHLKTQATLGDDPGRLSWKLALVKGLYERGLGREDIVRLFGFVDHLMALPQGLDEQFSTELAMFENEKKMTYVTSIERVGMRKGLEQGLEQGRLAMARESVLEALEVRFGKVPGAMKKRVESVSDPADCRLLLQAAITAASVELFEQRLFEVLPGSH
ncbi:MAG: hypothetical protein ACI80V_003267 [Rhodothermales bacterium]|jgi:hypothetical protein